MARGITSALHFEAGASKPPGLHAQEEPSDLAVNAKAFEVRYPARLALRSAGLDPPRDQPDGFFTFVVSYDEFTCSIELASSDSLASLHYMIQRALRWDGDHMWCFYLADGEHRELFTWPTEEGMAPAWSDESSFPLDAASDHTGDARPTHADADGKRSKAMWTAIRAARVEELEVIGMGPLALDPLECIGEFGFRAAQAFVYHFDFGPRWAGVSTPAEWTAARVARVARASGRHRRAQLQTALGWRASSFGRLRNSAPTHCARWARDGASDILGGLRTTPGQPSL